MGNMARRYWWGNEYFSKAVFGVAIAIWAPALSTVVLASTAPGAPGTTFPELRSTIGATLLISLAVYAHSGFQVNVSPRNPSTGESADNVKVSLIAERVLNNMLETLPVVLATLWMNAIFLDAVTAAKMGFLYAAGRLLYPIMYGWYGQFTVQVILATSVWWYAQYLLFSFMIGKVLFDVNIPAALDQNPFYTYVFCLVNVPFNMLLQQFPWAMVYTHVAKKGVAFKEASEK